MKLKIHLNWINLNKIDLLVNTRYQKALKIIQISNSFEITVIVILDKKIKSYKILYSTKLNSLINKIHP